MRYDEMMRGASNAFAIAGLIGSVVSLALGVPTWLVVLTAAWVLTAVVLSWLAWRVKP